MKLPALIQSSFFSFLVLLLCSLLLFLPSFGAAWTMDDYAVIVNNHYIRSFTNIFNGTLPLRPIRIFTYILDYSIFGLDPWGYHFQNIFWHALSCWLVYLVALRLKLSIATAWISSLLFLSHPIHVEVVANTSHRKDSLALVFILLAFLSYMRVLSHKRISDRMVWSSCTLILWAMAFFAKGNSLIFPAIIIVYEYLLVPEGERLLVRWKRMVPSICLASFIGLLGWYYHISTLPSFRMEIIGAFVKTANLTSFSVYAYILMVLKSCAFMFSKLVYPVNLSMEYIYSVPESLFDPWVLSALLLILFCCAIAVRWKNTDSLLAFLLIFSVILWLPTSNIFWHFSYFAADRYMYAPTSGLCMLAALFSGKLFCSRRKLYIVGWGCILLLCSYLTVKQTAFWRNEMSLYNHMLEVSPRSLEAMVGLSYAYYSKDDFTSAASYARKALERDHTDFRPYLILGKISFINKKMDEALDFIQESRKKNPQSPEVYNALGSLYDDTGNSIKAIDSFNTALSLRQDYFEAYTNLGVTYERERMYTEAEQVLKKAIAANANFTPAWFNLGVVYYRSGDKNAARAAFNEVLKLDASHVDALTNLTVVCKEIGDEVCYNGTLRRLDSIMPSAAEKLH